MEGADHVYLEAPGPLIVYCNNKSDPPHVDMEGADRVYLEAPGPLTPRHVDQANTQQLVKVLSRPVEWHLDPGER